MASFSKFDQQEWNIVEQKIDDPRKIKVIKELVKLGDNSIIDTSCKYKSCKESYLDIRIKIQDILSLSPINIDEPKKGKPVKGKKGKQGNKKDDIIKANTLKMLMKDYEKIISNYNNQDFNSLYSFEDYDYMEMKIVALFFAIQYMFYNMHCISELEQYEICIGVKKIIENLDSIQIKMNEINNKTFEICKNDLVFMFNKLPKDIDYEKVFNDYPRLAYNTKYDSIFSDIDIKPYKSQCDIVSIIKSNNPSLILYTTKIGSGKTSVCLAIAKYCQTVNKKLIFTCCVEPVRISICNLLFNANIPFAIGVTIRGERRIINSFISKNDYTVLVSDLETTNNILMENNQDYVLFLDEPTAKADTYNNEITKYVAKILKVMPKMTVLSSSTLPSEDKLAPILDYYRSTHNGQVVTIKTSESQIGCSVYCDENKFIPYNKCDTRDKLNSMIQIMEDNCITDRLFSPSILFNLYNDIKKQVNVPDLYSFLDQNVNNLHQTNIQKYTMEILKQIANSDNSIIKNICYKNINPDSSFNKYNNILSTNAHKYNNACLYVCENPFKTAYELYLEYINTNGETINVNQMIEDYSNKIRKFNSQVDKISHDQSKKVCINATSSNSSKSNKLDGKDKLFSKIEGKVDSISTGYPILGFPSYLQINTRSHYKKFCDMTDDFDCRTPLLLENLPMDLDITEWMYFLLFCGVGIYDPENELINNRYTNLIMSMASNKQLSFIISNDNIIYGTDYPLSNIILEDTFAQNHSINTIFQLFGRIGRVDKSWTANSYIEPNLYNRLENYLTGQIVEDDIEGDNIVNTFADLNMNILHNGKTVKINIKPLNDIYKN